MIDFKNPELLKLSPVKNASFMKTINEFVSDVPGEEVIAVFKTVRDGVVFTTKRIIVINIEGVGLKRDYTSLPYKNIQAFSIETAGIGDIDTELQLWFSGGIGLIKIEFTCGDSIKEICKYISKYSL